jgi:hypothetical protein
VSNSSYRGGEKGVSGCSYKSLFLRHFLDSVTAHQAVAKPASTKPPESAFGDLKDYGSLEGYTRRLAKDICRMKLRIRGLTRDYSEDA